MSRDRTGRLVERVIKAKTEKALSAIETVELSLSSLESTQAELTTNKKQLEILRDTSEDPRVCLGAAKQISDMALKIAELRLRIEEYKNPADKNINLSHIFPDKIECEILEIPKKKA